MSGGQAALSLEHGIAEGEEGAEPGRRARRDDLRIPVVRATAAELAAHEEALAAIERASGGRALFRGTPGSREGG
jgi:DNA polymerase-3 subunit epsilon